MDKISITKSSVLLKLCIVGFVICQLVFSSNLFSQTIDCNKFKVGTFELIDLKMENYIIKRNEKYQIETYKNKKCKFIVKWLDDCTYTLTPTKKTYKQYPEFLEVGVLTVKIIEVKENSYIQTCTSKLADIAVTREIIKID